MSLHRHFGIQSIRQAVPPSMAVYSFGLRRAFFIRSPLFKQREVSQAAVDVLAFLFGIGFLFICTVGLATAIGALIYFAVIV